MFRNKLLAIGAVIAGLLLPAQAMAAYEAYTRADLNLRVGPDVTYGVIDVIPYGEPVVVLGCLDHYYWCDVEWFGLRGWVSARYLVQPGTEVYLPQFAPRVGLPIIAFSFITYHDRHYRDRPWYKQRHGRWRGRDWRRHRDRDRPRVERPRQRRDADRPREGERRQWLERREDRQRAEQREQRRRAEQRRERQRVEQRRERQRVEQRRERPRAEERRERPRAEQRRERPRAEQRRERVEQRRERPRAEQRREGRRAEQRSERPREGKRSQRREERRRRGQ